MGAEFKAWLDGLSRSSIRGGWLAAHAAYKFAEGYEERQEWQWRQADICAVLSRHPSELVRLVDQLENNFGIKITATSLSNYARVANAFSKEHRHFQYKWSNYLEWSKHPDPIEAMELALDNGYSPTQMSRLRRHGDPEYKRVDKCGECGGNLLHCEHNDKGQAGRLEQRDKELEGPEEDRQEESLSQKEDGKE